MEFFERTGTFFPPSSSESSAGDLVGSGDAFVLRLDAPLAEIEYPEQRVGEEPPTMRLPLLFGNLRGDDQVTLLNAIGTGHDQYQSWRAPVALLGEHVTDPRFVRTGVEFDLLTAWTDPPSLVTWNRKGALDGRVSLERTVLDTAEFDDMKVELVSTSSGTGGHLVVDLKRQTWLVVEHEPMSIDDLNEVVIRPLKDLLVVLLGRSVTIANLTVTPASGGKPRQVKFREVVANEYVDYEPLWLRSWGSETFMTRKELPVSFDELMTGWFRSRPDLRTATGLLCSSFYASFMYAETWLTSTFQAAEDLAKPLVEQTPEQKAIHEERVDRVLAALNAGDLPEADLEWAATRVRGGSQPGLATKVTTLLKDAGLLGDQVLTADPKFPRNAAGLRSSASHPAAMNDQLYARMHWSEVVLRWIVRARLLTQAGLPANEVVKAVERRGTFADALERLGETQTR